MVSIEYRRNAASLGLVKETDVLRSLFLFGLMIIAAGPAQANEGFICWVDRVEIDGEGVRVIFKAGAPIAPPNRTWRGKLGDSVSPSNSGHDGCNITVTEIDGELGVLAESHFFALHIMKKPEVRREWIAAQVAP